jgi:hypothetical protein
MLEVVHCEQSLRVLSLMRCMTEASAKTGGSIGAMRHFAWNGQLTTGGQRGERLKLKNVLDQLACIRIAHG